MRRRTILKLAAVASVMPTTAFGKTNESVRVVVWDERQPQQQEAYDNFLGNQIASYLRGRPGLTVKSVALDDPEQGLSEEVLDDADVLVWWGHVRQAEVTPETGRRLVDRIVKGELALIALHSAHWSTPFVEAMYERTRRDAERRHPDAKMTYVLPAQRYTVPRREDRLTPYESIRKFPDGHEEVEVHLPVCCFPAYRGDGKPSTIHVTKTDHPIVQGLPPRFEIAHTEMYDEPFHVPEPDEVLLEECWASGEWFRSGMVWRIGEGRVAYFRPGHETYPVFKEEWPLRLLENAARWLAS